MVKYSLLNSVFSPAGLIYSQVKKSRGGASRKNQSAKVGIPEWIKYSGKLAVVGCAAAIITAALVWFNPKQKLQSFSGKPIKAVQLEGRFEYLNKQETSELVAGMISGTFIHLDIGALKENLESSPWIDSVIVTREWPDKLVVRVVEQQPIAQWGKKGFLNMRGDIIEVEKATKIQALPSLNGEDRFAKEIMQQYLQMNKLLQPKGLNLVSVTLDTTQAWQIVLNESIVVKLGRDRVLQKLLSLATAKNSVLKEDFDKVKAIDMRYPSGFAVAWKGDQQLVEAQGFNQSL